VTKPTISLVVIALDEELAIGRCLACFADMADEIVVAMDNRTKDHTARIAEEFGANVVSFEWKDDFSAARNLAYSHAAMDWVVWADCDDVITDEDREKLLMAIHEAEKDGKTSVTVPYILGTDADGTPTTEANLKVRASRKGALTWLYRIHEVPSYDGAKDVIRRDIPVFHKKTLEKGNRDKDRNLHMLERALAEPHEVWMKPRYLFYLAREQRYHGMSDLALKTYREYLPISTWTPERHRALIDMSGIHLDRKEYDEAAMRAFEALQLEPEWVDPYVALMWVAYHQQRWQSVVDWATLAIMHQGKTHPLFDWTPHHTWLPHYIMAVGLWNLKRWKDGLEHARIAKGFQPDHVQNNQNIRFFEEKIAAEAQA